jgi:hypothetical protein
MDSLWYFARAGQSLGPVPFAELKRLAATGELLAGDLVRREGSADWQPAGAVPDLFAAPPPPTVSPLPAPIDAHEPLILSVEDAPSVLLLDEPQPAGQREDGENRDRRDRDRDDDRRPRRDREDDDRGARRDRDEDDRYADDRDDRRSRDDDPLELVNLNLQRAFSLELRTLPVTASEERDLRRAGITALQAQRYAVWRKSLLWFVVFPSAVAALFHFINLVSMEKQERDVYSRFGMALIYLQVFSLFALPVTAALAAASYVRVRKSFNILLLGAVIAFGVPLATALIPAEHILDLKGGGDEEKIGVGVLFGLVFFISVLPTILALLPAIGRASVRVKSLVPTSITPGWGLLTSAPLYVLLGFAAFILIYHVVGNFLLILGVLLWVGAPLIYMTRADLMIRPLTRTKDFRAIARLHWYVLSTVGVGVLFIVIFLFTAKFGRKYLVGTDKLTSWIRPWDVEIHARWIEFVGRSLFLTVVFADLLLRMNISIWKQEKEFYRTPAADEYDHEMGDLDAALTPPRRERDDRDDDRDRDRDRDDRR